MKKKFLGLILSLGLILTVSSDPVLADDKDIPEPFRITKCEIAIEDNNLSKSVSCDTSN